MKKLNYETPDMEVIKFSTEDVITNSVNDDIGIDTDAGEDP